MTESQNVTAPEHLNEQIIVYLNRAIITAYQHLYDIPEAIGAYVTKDYVINFKREFDFLRAWTESKMQDQNEYFDAHKLAAISLIATLRSRPFQLSSGADGHGLNEIVAFRLAVYILWDYQIDRACAGDEDKRSRMREQMKGAFLHTPNRIYAHQDVTFAFIMMMCFLSDVASQPEQIYENILPINSMLIFYMDAYSYGIVESIT